MISTGSEEVKNPAVVYSEFILPTLMLVGVAFLFYCVLLHGQPTIVLIFFFLHSTHYFFVYKLLVLSLYFIHSSQEKKLEEYNTQICMLMFIRFQAFFFYHLCFFVFSSFNKLSSYYF
jgi:hypothetical protein